MMIRRDCRKWAALLVANRHSVGGYRTAGPEARKPTYLSAFKRRRCLVLADGFYEWQKFGRTKTPMRITMESGGPFAFAGLWALWKDPEGNTVPSCSIITTEANDLIRPIHNRMPVILPRDMEQFWLDRDVQDTTALESVLASIPPKACGPIRSQPS